MIPGPDQIIACPYCQGLEAHFTLVSGNTFGMRTWTDGRHIAPMLPALPPVARCHHCARCYWLADARRVGSYERWSTGTDVNPAWEAAPSIEEPSEKECYAALAGALASDRDQERQLRTLAWWRRNDAFRAWDEDAPPQSAGDMDGACRQNMEALLSLVGKTKKPDLLMRAELLRELGNFDAVREALDQVTQTRYRWVVQQIRALCDSEDVTVRELVDEPPPEDS